MDSNTPDAPKQNAPNPKQQTIDRLKQASNVLVTVSSNPSVDQLAACIGLTLMLNKLGKHGTAVYSGETPSTIEFLKPEETLEKTTDSLRDFIIALDKSKADKLRYKVEDKIVQIFITPYRTSLSEKDLDFSLGDFNVDAVIALGVHQQTELDQAITAHGRILHDATIISINTTSDTNLGSINWQDTKTSSLSEMVADLGNGLGKNVFDAQIATALLTGIVASTDRFSNDKTFSETMSISAQLIAAGANQQLVATKLEEAQEPEEPPAPPPQPAPIGPSQPPAGRSPATSAPNKPDDGTLVIEHEAPKPPEPPAPLEPPEPEEEPKQDENQGLDLNQNLEVEEGAKDENGDPINQIDIDKEGTLRDIKEMEKESAKPSTEAGGLKVIQPLQPPPGPAASAAAAHNITGGVPMVQGPPIMAGGTLTANSQSEGLDPTTDPLSLPPVDSPLLKRDITSNFSLPKDPLSNTKLADSALTPLVPEPPSPIPAPTSSMPDLENARKAVEAMEANNPDGQLKPLEALNAQPVFENLQSPPPTPGLITPDAGTTGATALPEIEGHHMLDMPMPAATAPAAEPGLLSGDIEDSPSGGPALSPSEADAASSPMPSTAPPVPPPMTPPMAPPVF